MSQILVATSNSGKVKELNKLLYNESFEFLSLSQIEGLESVDSPIENGDSYQKNAQIKVDYYSEFTNLPVLADDSGIECLDLANWPGIHSARIAKDDASRRQVLLAKLKTLGTREPWNARFVCSLCFYFQGKHYFFTESCEGEIRSQEKGELGFGYDPIFYMPDGRSLGEYSADEKNAVSHRGKAVAEFIKFLDSLILT